MMRRNSGTTSKYLLLVSVLMLMLVLCGCRSRLTNNTDVIATISDEDGYLSSNYEMRRDELGKPVAEKPIFTGWGSSDDEDYDYDSESLDNYEDYEESWDETDDFPESDTDSETDNGTTSTTTTTTPGTGRTTVPTRPATATGNIVVTLDPNGGSVNPTSIRVSKDSTYIGLPLANREGYDFQGWFTEKEDGKGSQGTSSTKVEKSTAHTLYAHWKESDNDADKVTITLDLNDGHGTQKTRKVTKNTTFGKALPKSAEWAGHEFTGWYTKKKGGTEIDSKKKVTKDTTVYAHWKKSAEPEKKQYTVSFDGNGGNDQVVVEPGSIQVEEDGTYGTLPAPSRAGYRFAGWYTERDGGSQVKAGDAFKANTDQILYARWDEDWYNYLDGEYKKTANSYKPDVDCYVYNDDSPSKGKKSLIEDSKGNCVTKTDGEDFDPACVLIFGDPSDKDTEEKAKAAYEEYKDGSAVILIVPTDAVEGTNNQKLYYRMLLLNLLHGDPISKDQLDLMLQKLDIGDGTPISFYPPASDESSGA